MHIYHVNLIISWVEPESWFLDLVWEDSELGPGSRMTMRGKEPSIGEQLSSSQKRQLQEVIYSFRDLLTEELGKAQGVKHRMLEKIGKAQVIST